MEIFPEFFQNFPPLARVALAFFLVLVVPMLCRRFSLPAVVGLLAAGVIIGPHGLKIIPQNPVVGNFLAELGKLMLMMFAGIEIDHALFRRVWRRSLMFGFFTFLLPLLAGVVVSLLFGYYWVAALLIGSLLASHTLLGFPIVQQSGLAGRDVVSVTTGATIFTDVGSLLILAICLPIHMSGFSPGALGLQLVLLLGYVPLVIIGIGKLGAWLMPKLSGATDREFGLVLFLMILAAFGAEIIHLEPIIGAFMVGLAIGPVTRHAKGFEHLEFIGQTLFIPIFFVSIGFHINLGVFVVTLIDNLPLVLAIVGGLIFAKFVAALITQRLYRFTPEEGLLMWSLSLPQVAATLAAAMVAYNTVDRNGHKLIDEPILNTIIVLMVVTSILGPVLTEKFTRKIVGKGSATAGAA